MTELGSVLELACLYSVTGLESVLELANLMLVFHE